MRNLTVNMPLAVPHQRPPSKYASHPYPVLVDEVMALSSYCSGFGVLLPINKDEMSIASLMYGDGVLRSVLVEYELPIDSMRVSSACVGEGELIRKENGKYNAGLESMVVNTHVAGSGILKNILITHNAGTDEMTVSAKTIGTGIMI